MMSIDTRKAGDEETRAGVGCNGSAMAAFLAACTGAFTVGLVVVLHEIGAFSAPALYGPAGGVSGRTTIAIIVWLVAWGILHSGWKGRDIAPARVAWICVILTALGILGTFPPLWTVLSP
jgi:hypothetical protein